MAGGAQQRGGIISGINVTPLVDIVLVLLVIFMVTAKFVVTPAIPLDLPQAAASETVQTILAVHIEPDGSLGVNGTPCSKTELRHKAEKMLEQEEGLRAVIRADGSVPHRRVMQVLDALKSVGLQRVAFAAKRAPSDATSSQGNGE